MDSKFFREVFDDVNIVMLNEKWIKSQYEFKKSTNDLYRAVFSNVKKQDAYITFDYPTPRMYAEGCPKQ